LLIVFAVFVARLCARIVRARKGRIVAGSSNGLHQNLRIGKAGIEHHRSPIGHQVDMRRLDTRGRAQRRFDVMLTRRARHPDHRERYRL
jgi:hypothetical protein